MDTSATLIFIIAAFSLGAIVIMKRDSIPPSMRRGISLITIALIAFAFFLIVFSFFNMGG